MTTDEYIITARAGCRTCAAHWQRRSDHRGQRPRSPDLQALPEPPYPTGARMNRCRACGLPVTPHFDGQTLHPLCHGDHPPTASCAECVAERRAHRAAVARKRHRQFTDRTTERKS